MFLARLEARCVECERSASGEREAMRAESRRLEELVARGRDEVARVRDALRDSQQTLHERQLALQRAQQELGDVQHAVRLLLYHLITLIYLSLLYRYYLLVLCSVPYRC